jgi:hypothetical protein
VSKIHISIRSAARYLFLWLVIVALLMAALPVVAQGPDEPPDEAAKRKPPTRGEGRLVSTKDRAIIAEDFEDGVMPPPGWTHLQTNPNEAWQIGTYDPYNGIYDASVLYDPALLDQNEVLLSPTFTADSGDVSLWSLGSLYWCRDSYDNCDLEVWFVNGTWDWGGGDDVFLGLADNDWTATWEWSNSVFDFSAYASGNPARIAFRYVGNDGAQIDLDGIDINYSSGGACGDPHEPNDTPGGATPISYGTTLTDPDICPAGDEDYYSFSGGIGDLIVVDIDAYTAIGSSLDPVLHLYDTDGVTELASNDDYDGLDSYLEYTLPANGTYYLKVRDYGTPHGGPDFFYNIYLDSITAEPAEWTFMVYLDGDNDLEGAGIDDFMEMSTVGSNSEVNILVQFDRISGYDSSNGNWTSTKRFRVMSGMAPTSGSALQDIGEANMGDPATLIDFVQWGMTSYPADHYAVVVWDHGSGWRLRPEEVPPVKDVAYDDSSGGDALDMPELLAAMDTLSNGGSDPLDLVGFDACLMGMIEVDNQLIPYVDVRVGSEETEPWDGWPFDAILSALVADPTMSAGQLGTVIVDEYYASYGNSETQSAVDLGTPYDALNTTVDDFALALMGGVCAHYDEIENARGSTQEFYNPIYIDLYDFAYQVSQEVNDATIDAAATAVMNAVNGAVIREQHGGGWPGAHGISIYFPESASSYDGDYDGDTGWLQFTADTQWDEWLHAFYEPCPLPENIVWEDDMESGVNGWVADGFWHQVEDGVSPYPESYSPTHSWWYGQDATGDYDNGVTNSGSLTSPAIAIPSTASIAGLGFWSWYETETSGLNWDQRWVQISVDGGPFQDLDQLSGDPMETWIHHALDLTPYIGSQVRIRFYFDTLDEIHNNHRGWYVDDVYVAVDVAPEVVDLRVEPPNQTVSSTGGTFFVDIVAEDVIHLGAFQFDLVYDPAILQFDSANLGPFLGSTGCTVMEVEPTSVPGRLTYGGHIVGTCPGPSGEGAVARVVFRPVEPPVAGESDLTLENEQLLNSDDPPAPITPVDLFTGHVTVTTCFFADVDCDGDVDIADIYGIAYVWGCQSGDPSYNQIYDLDDNGYITTGDIQIAVCYFGWPTGNFDICYSPTAIFEEEVLQSATVSVEPSVTVLDAAGEVFTITVDIANAINLGSFEFELDYDPDIVQVNEVALGDTVSDMGFNPQGPNIDNTAGRVIYGAWTPPGFGGFDGSTTLATIILEASRVGSSALDLVRVEVTDVGGNDQSTIVKEGNVYVGVEPPAPLIFLPTILKDY